ncbi:MAG: hypothetical protein H6737_17160 [Alphaproteobacteria bacterium]|nr:hypothetical protein [Alphaproteobacteria bacterium]
MGLESKPWWKDLLARKDTMSLRDLAAEFQTTPGAISLALKRTNTSRVPQGEALPPEAGDPRPGSKDEKIEPYREMLGSVPDAEVAKKAGVSVRTIASYRSRNQIEGYRGRSAPRKERKPRRSKIDPFADLVGTVPDRVIAEKAGVTLNAVRNYRAARGITSSRQRARDTRDSGPVAAAPTSAAPRPAAASASVPAVSTAPKPVPTSQRVETPAPARAATGGFAWLVRFDSGAEGIVLGADLVQAAQNAGTAGRGNVLGIERVGALL